MRPKDACREVANEQNGQNQKLNHQRRRLSTNQKSARMSAAAEIATAGAARKDGAVNLDGDTGTRVQFVLTSFGPFQGVAVNPTQLLLDRFRGAGECLPTVLVETSAEAALAAVDEIYNTHRPLLRDRTVVVVHLGVNYRGKVFQIEQCAYNDAMFRIPDQKVRPPLLPA